MTDIDEAREQFTGLILLTGVDRPGLSAALFETLAPFAISVIDVEQLIISDRLILTVLIGLNPSHQKAIEADLDQCALENEVDIATLFENRPLLPVKSPLIEIEVCATKLHPATLSLLSKAINEIGGNIESITRTDSTKTCIVLTISNSAQSEIENAVSTLSFEDGAFLSIKART